MSRVDSFQPTERWQFTAAAELLADVLRDLNTMPYLNETAIMMVEHKLTMLRTRQSSLNATEEKHEH